MVLPAEVQRLQLPMRFYGAVNAWLIGPPGNQAIIDTGMPDQATAAAWEDARGRGMLDGVKSILLTHSHIDHVGQAMPLASVLNAELFMSVAEHAELLRLSQTDLQQRLLAFRSFLERGGFDPDHFGSPTDYGVLGSFSRKVTILQDGEVVELGGTPFEVIIGAGHSIAPICLLSRERKLLISGDQILAGAGPQIAVAPERPDSDVLGDYLAFLDRIAGLPAGLLVLPGHGEPFTDLHERIADIRRRHLDRIARLSDRMKDEMTLAAMAELALGNRIPTHMQKRAPFVVAGMANYLLNKGVLAFSQDAGRQPVRYRAGP